MTQRDASEPGPTTEVVVGFYGALRPIIGAHVVTFRVPEPATLAKLLSLVLERAPALRPELVDDQGRPHPYVHLFMNGRDHPYLADQLETRLGPEDRVDVFPATAGGCVDPIEYPPEEE